MISERILYLAERYFDQSCTSEEKEELAEWVSNTADDHSLNELLKRVWDGRKETGSMPEDMSDRILASLFPPVASLPRRSIFQRYRWQVAAAIVIILSIGAWLWIGNVQEKPIAKESPGVEQITPYIRNIMLDDGSMVVLHAGSKLDYVSDFNKNGAREVRLAGEAYFDIKHDASRPFIIYTGTVKTTVLGTAFNVKAYDSLPEVVVSVTRGKVQVEDKKKVIAILTHDQQVIYNRNVSNIVQQDIKAEEVVTTWTKTDMNFNAVALESIVQSLSTRYSAGISLANESLKNCLVTVSFSGTESLPDILSVICTILGNSFEVKESGEFVINGKGCE